MRLEAIELLGFGALGGRHVFAPGLNVVHGPNEAGKSTLVAALLLGLCGRPKKRGRQHDPLDRYRPWSQAPFRLRLVVRLDAGGRFELLQDLDEPSRSKVVDLDLGRDRTSELLSERAPDGSHWLELDRSIVARTLVVRQSELAAVRSEPGELQSMLQRAATRGAPDATANQALARIEVFQKERVGSEHASSTKPLKKALEAERQARRALEEARGSGDELRDLAERARRLAGEAARLRIDQAHAHAWAVADERQALSGRLAALAVLDERLAAFADDSSIPGEPRAPAMPDAIAALEAVVDRVVATRLPDPLPGPDIAALTAEVSALPANPEGELEPDPALLRAERSRQLAAEASSRHEAARLPRPAAPATRASPHALRELASLISSPPLAAPNIAALPLPRVSLWPYALFAAGCIAFGLGLGLAGWLAALGALATGAGIVWHLRRRRFRETQASANAAAEATWRRHRADVAHHEARCDEARATLVAAGVAPDPASARAAALELESLGDAERAFASWSVERAHLATAAESTARALAGLLAARGADAFDAYIDACRARAAQAALAQRRCDLERLVAERRLSEAAHARQTAAVVATHTALDRALGALGDANQLPWDRTSGDLDRIGSYLVGERRRHALAGERSALMNDRELLLHGTTLEHLRERLALLPEVDVATTTRPALAPERLDEDAADYERTAARLQGELSARREGAPAIADAEEALARARLQLERLRRLDRDLGLAMQYLAEARDAVHRDIAPRLAAALTAIVPQLTGGRYRDARVAADTLEVAVGDEDGQWRNAELLSHGTSEQLYLALRVVLAQSLTKPGESPPLIFDDITAHADPARRDAMLAWLATLAERHQVFLFTSDPTVAASPHLEGATHLALGLPSR